MKKIVTTTVSLLDKLYLPAIIMGMWITFKHLINTRKFTINYPEERKPLPARYRGAHRLNKDKEGRVVCVACEMCSTACPAQCIDIVPDSAPWQDRERYPIKFEINMLRCVFCGMCVEACPEDAIDMTSDLEFDYFDRSGFIWDKEKLLSNFEKTKDQMTFGQSIRNVMKTPDEIGHRVPQIPREEAV